MEIKLKPPIISGVPLEIDDHEAKEKTNIYLYTLFFPLDVKASRGWGISADHAPCAVRGVQNRARKEVENGGAAMATRC